MGKKERFYVDIMATHPGVTGSCNLMNAKFPNGESLKFIVDCGLFQERKYDVYNQDFPFKAENIAFVLVTHTHIDHIGRLPLLEKNGFYKEIYATEDTCKLMPLALHDSHKVLASSAKQKNQKCLYSETDVERVLSSLKPCSYRQTITPAEHIRVTFFKNGHLIGAAIILVQISYPGYDDINLLFTGDYHDKNLFFDVAPFLPKWVSKLPLTIISESTYGYMDSTEIEKCFRNNVLRQIGENGMVIVPVISLGRAQEVLYEVKCMQEEGKLKNIPIYLDGKLAIHYTGMFGNGMLAVKEKMKNFLPENLTIVDKNIRNRIIWDWSPKILITSSGMGSYGPAHQYIQEYITREKALIHFTCYTAEGTLGRRLKDAQNGETIEIGGIVLKKRAKVEYTTEFSKHAKADEIIMFLKQFLNVKLILLNHGEEDTKRIFANRVIEEINPKKIGVLSREYFFRVNSNGLIKTLSSKFI